MSNPIISLKTPYKDPILISSYVELTIYALNAIKNNCVLEGKREAFFDYMGDVVRLKKELKNRQFLDESPLDKYDLQRATEETLTFIHKSDFDQCENYNLIVPITFLDYQSIRKEAKQIYREIMGANEEIRNLKKGKVSGGIILSQLTRRYLEKLPITKSHEQIVDSALNKQIKVCSISEMYIYAKIIDFAQNKRTTQDIMKQTKTLYYRFAIDFTNRCVTMYGGQCMAEGLNPNHVQPWTYDGIEEKLKSSTFEELQVEIIQQCLNMANRDTVMQLNERISLFFGNPTQDAYKNERALKRALKKRYGDNVYGKSLAEVFRFHTGYGFDLLKAFQHVYLDIYAIVGILLQYNKIIEIKTYTYKKVRTGNKRGVTTRNKKVTVEQYYLKTPFANELTKDGIITEKELLQSMMNNILEDDTNRLKQIIKKIEDSKLVTTPYSIVLKELEIEETDFIEKVISHMIDLKISQGINTIDHLNEELITNPSVRIQLEMHFIEILFALIREKRPYAKDIEGFLCSVYSQQDDELFESLSLEVFLATFRIECTNEHQQIVEIEKERNEILRNANLSNSGNTNEGKQIKFTMNLKDLFK